MNFIYILTLSVVVKKNSIASPITTDDGTLQNLHLMIEEKLTKLEELVTINGRLNYYGTKIDKMEKSLEKFQAHSNAELQKSSNFGEKNLDAIYGIIDQKLREIREQVDLKMKSIEDAIMIKLEKFDENLHARDSDIEAELTDAVAAIDDFKSTFTNMEENAIDLIRKSTEKISEESTNYYKRVESNTKYISDYMQQVLNSLVNQTTITTAKNEILESIANKFEDIRLSVWQKSESFETKLKKMSNLTNQIRNELQNNFRSFIIQFGRLAGKENIQNDYHNKLEELNKKVDVNFRDVLLMQNLFLESCHRVQMDEEQLEYQISTALNKLIDIFENKISDAQQLEHAICTHDILTENNKKICNPKQREIIQILLENSKLLKTILNLEINEEPQSEELNSINAKINNLLSKTDVEEISVLLNHQDILDLIVEIFEKPPTSNNQLHYFSANKSEIESTMQRCNFEKFLCKKIYNTTYSIKRENENDYIVLNCLVNSTDGMLLCTLIKDPQMNCLNLNDVRFNNEDFKKCIDALKDAKDLTSDFNNMYNITST